MTTHAEMLRRLIAPEALDAARTGQVLFWARTLAISKSDALSGMLENSLAEAMEFGVVTHGKKQRISNNKSALWALTDIKVDQARQLAFDALASEMLWQVGRCAQYLVSDGLAALLGYVSAVRKAGGALVRLLSLNPQDLTTLQALYSSNVKNALNDWIELWSDKSIISDLKSLRSLQNLAHGHRSLRKGAGKRAKKSQLERPRTRLVEIMATTEEIEQGIQSIHQDFIALDEDDEEAHDGGQLIIVTCDLEKVAKNYPSRTRTQKQLFAQAVQIANQRARANNFSKLDLRLIKPGVLEAIDRYLLGPDTIKSKALILLPLLAGRALKSLTIGVFDAVRTGSIRVPVNIANVQEKTFALPVMSYVDVPIPIRWLDTFQRISELFKGVEDLGIGYEKAQRRVLKSIDEELTEVQLRHYLPIMLKHTTGHEAFSSLLCDSITSTDLTRHHYFCIHALHVQVAVYETWRYVVQQLDCNQGVTLFDKQDGYIGAPNTADPLAVEDWLAEQGDTFLSARQALVAEGKVLCHRGVIDPQAELVLHAGGNNLAVLNDKDRGGRGQMRRLVVLGTAGNDLVKENNKQFCRIKHSTDAPWLYPDARLLNPNDLKPISPSQLCKASPELPATANIGRKLFASTSLGMPGEFVAIQMGWLSHGTVPFSPYSSLSPVMLAWAMRLHHE